MSYQHVNGVTMSEALQQLYSDGGIPRFYKGLAPALVMMPLSRFGDIFSNELSKELLSDSWPAAVVTMFASSMAASWRIVITPADTVKTMMQVHGTMGLQNLQNKVSKSGFTALYEGALGASAATWVRKTSCAFKYSSFLAAEFLSHFVIFQFLNRLAIILGSSRTTF